MSHRIKTYEAILWGIFGGPTVIGGVLGSRRGYKNWEEYKRDNNEECFACFGLPSMIFEGVIGAFFGFCWPVTLWVRACSDKEIS